MFTLNIKATNLPLTPDVRAYLEKRMQSLEKLIEKDDTGVVCDVELERDTHHQQGDVFRAEVTFRTRRGSHRADAKGETIEAAIDVMKKAALRELRRAKRKERTLLRRGGTALKEFTHELSARGVQVKDYVIGWRKRR